MMRMKMIIVIIVINENQSYRVYGQHTHTPYYSKYKQPFSLKLSIFWKVHSVFFLRFVDRASRYIRVMKTNLIHCLSSVYFINQPLHVLGIFVAHHQDVYCIYTIVLFSWLFHHNSDNRQSTKKLNTYQLLHIYSIPLDDGLQICQKHVEVDGRSKLRINSAQRRFSLHGQTVCV